MAKFIRCHSTDMRKELKLIVSREFLWNNFCKYVKKYIDKNI